MDEASPAVVAYSSQPLGILARDRDDGVGADPCLLGFKLARVSGSGSVMMCVLISSER
jgi:hypothetical protein